MNINEIAAHIQNNINDHNLHLSLLSSLIGYTKGLKTAPAKTTDRKAEVALIELILTEAIQRNQAIRP